MEPDEDPVETILIRGVALLSASLDPYPGHVSLEMRTAANERYLRTGSFDS